MMYRKTTIVHFKVWKFYFIAMTEKNWTVLDGE